MLKTFHITQDLCIITEKRGHGDARRNTAAHGVDRLRGGRLAMRPVDPSREAVTLLKLRAEAGLRLPADGCTGRVGGGNG